MNEYINRYREVEYEIQPGVLHTPVNQIVHKGLDIPNIGVWVIGTGAPEGANKFSDSKKETLDEFFKAATSAVQVYLGKPTLTDRYKTAPLNMQTALRRTSTKTDLVIGTFSGGSYFSALGITEDDAKRITRLLFFSPVLGRETIKIPIIRHLLGKTEDHLDRLRPVVETVSSLSGPENVLFLTGDNTDPFVNGDIIAEKVYKAFGDKVQIIKGVYPGHPPPMNLMIDYYRNGINAFKP